jgi:hypothetical protein
MEFKRIGKTTRMLSAVIALSSLGIGPLMLLDGAPRFVLVACLLGTAFLLFGAITGKSLEVRP